MGIGRHRENRQTERKMDRLTVRKISHRERKRERDKETETETKTRRENDRQRNTVREKIDKCRERDRSIRGVDKWRDGYRLTK